jgi:hypothetical protein
MRFIVHCLIRILFLGVVGCTPIDTLTRNNTPCDYLQGIVAEAHVQNEIRHVEFKRAMTLAQVIECIGEPEWTVGEVGGFWGWLYRLELWYPHLGVSVRGETDHFVSDVYDENRNPGWVDTTILFENPEDVIPSQLPVTTLILTPSNLSIDDFTEAVVDSFKPKREAYLEMVHPWAGWDGIEIYDPTSILERN